MIPRTDADPQRSRLAHMEANARAKERKEPGAPPHTL